MHYKHGASEPALHLFDYTRTDNSIHYGMAENASSYNSLTVSKRLLCDNGIESRRIFVHDADCGLPRLQHVSVVLSLLSWGFHYPIELYLQTVTKMIEPDGCLIIDIRHDTGGENVLRSQFSRVYPIAKFKSYVRYFVACRFAGGTERPL